MELFEAEPPKPVRKTRYQIYKVSYNTIKSCSVMDLFEAEPPKPA